MLLVVVYAALEETDYAPPFSAAAPVTERREGTRKIMEYLMSTGIAGVGLLNAACVLNAGFRSYQALRKRGLSCVQNGRENGQTLPRVPALPQLSSSDEDDAEKVREQEDGFVELEPMGNSDGILTLDVVTHWLYYWTAFAFLRFLQIHISVQFAYLQLLINLAVLFSPAGAALSKAVFDIGIVPVMSAIEANVAPHTKRGAIFFHSAFSQCVRGIHTEVAKISIPYSSEDQLQRLENHCTQMSRLLQAERRRRRVAQWSESQSAFEASSMSRQSRTNNDVVSASGGLRRRNKLKSRARPAGIRQSLGLW